MSLISSAALSVSSALAASSAANTVNGTDKTDPLKNKKILKL